MLALGFIVRLAIGAVAPQDADNEQQSSSAIGTEENANVADTQPIGARLSSNRLQVTSASIRERFDRPDNTFRILR